MKCVGLRMRKFAQILFKMNSTSVATLDQAKEMGLLPEKFDKIKEILGRTPNYLELSVYGVMWSETARTRTLLSG